MKTVADAGPTDARIMLIGEAPGGEEEMEGVPFVGPAGRMLKQMCSKSGIIYDQCRVTNVLNVRPPGNKFGIMYEDSKRNTPRPELVKSWELLRAKVVAHKPELVICLGGEALRALTGERGIEDWRGCFTTYDGIKVMPTTHPSYVLRVYGHHAVVELDLIKARNELSNTGPLFWQPIFKLAPTLADVVSFRNRIKDDSILAFDVETIGSRIRCISLAMGERECPDTICIPFIMLNQMDTTGMGIEEKAGGTSDFVSYWSPENERLVLQILAQIFHNPKIRKVGQNSVHFDQWLLEREFKFRFRNHCLDLMHAWHLLFLEFPKSLNFLTSILTHYPAYWNSHNTTVDVSEWKYCSYDSASTLSCAYEVVETLQARNMLDMYQTFVHPLLFVLTRCSAAGVLIDRNATAIAKEELRAQMSGMEAEIHQYFGKEVNINSPKQLAEALYEDKGFPRATREGRITTDEEALKALARRYPSEQIFGQILKYRKAQKVVSGFLSVTTSPDGRMHTAYNASGTDTGRISSSENIFGEGTNLQNVPAGRRPGVPNVRNCFIARPGYKLVKCDLSQAETMVVAWILTRYGDMTLYTRYTSEDDFDIHRWMASHIYKVLEEDVNKAQRDVGKVSNHSGNYGAGPHVLVAEGLKHDVVITFQMAKLLNMVRHTAIPGLRLWWGGVERQLRKNRTLTTCFGRERQFFGRYDSTTFRSAYAFEPQSTVGDLCNRILVAADEIFVSQTCGSESFAVPLLQVHDEIVTEVREDRIPEVAGVMTELSRIPLPISPHVPPLIIPIDISVGDNWRDTVPLEEYLNQ